MIAYEQVEFEGSQGHLLAARLETPASLPRGYAVFAHCFTCSKDLAAASRISKALAAKGIAVLRFDFTGLGHSDGEFANTNFSSNVEDIRKAAAWLREHHEAPTLLVGHSLGGAAVLAVASSLPEVRAVATIGAPSDTAHLEHLFSASVPEIESSGSAEVVIGGRPFRVQRQFLEDIRGQHLDARIAEMGAALMVMHSPIDNIVGVHHAARIFDAARHPKSYVSLGEADHLLTRRVDAEYAALVLSAWADRYLPLRTDDPDFSTKGVTVEEMRTGKYAQVIRARGHEFIGDEPTSVGGDDSGPTPYELLMAALGTCTSMTLRMYADRKNWSLGPVKVRMSHEKIHAKDCEACETKDGRVDRIVRELVLSGDLTEEQRIRLLEIADRCPVHRTLESEVQVVTRASDPQAASPT